jgi:PAT family beta-lactamase induction signal transducer AmpG
MYIIWFSKDNRQIENINPCKEYKQLFKDNFIQPFKELFKLKHFALILPLIAFYKASDGYLDAMLIPFLIDIGFTKAEIAFYSQTVGITFSIIGSLAGGFVLSKINIIRCLIIAEVLASCTNLLFLTLTQIGYNCLLLGMINSIESFFSGICNITIIHYMSSLCQNKRFTATHYAILSSIAGLTRALLSSSSGFIALNLGWVSFFIVSSLLSIPTLSCIYMLYKKHNEKFPS